jgi:hypothetical protein
MPFVPVPEMVPNKFATVTVPTALIPHRPPL